MIQTIENAFWATVQYIGWAWPVMGVYGVVTVFLGETIAKWGFMHSSLQKVGYYAIAIIFSAAVGGVLGFMFGHSFYVGCRVFFMTAPAAIVAVYKLYNPNKKESHSN